MNAGFISPTFRVLELNWDTDYEMVKLGVPTVMGYLYRAGHRDISHWDFDAQICEVMETDPNAFDLRAYFDAGQVAAFVAGTDDALRGQTERLLAVLGVSEHAIFGVSLSAVLDRIVNVLALAGLAECMAKVLKERYPRSTIVFGGLQVSPESLHESYYRRFMEECPYIDYCHLRMAGVETVQLFRNIWQGRPERMAAIHNVLYRGVDAEGRPAVLVGGESNDLDPDLMSMPRIQQTKHHPAHTQAGAARQHDAAVSAASAMAGMVLPSSALVRRPEGPERPPVEYERTHNADGTEIDARTAGDQPYSTIPALVPVFNPALVDRFRYSGQQIMRRFRFDEERLLRYSRFEGDRIVVLPHIFVRGCNAPCGFCTYAYRPIEGEDVIETVEGLKWLSETYGCKHFHFLNTQINSVYNYAEAFCDAVIAARLDILWSDCANMRMLDEPLLDKLRRAGAMRLVYGVESPEDEMLRYMHKGTTIEKVERMLAHSHALGIWNHVLLIAGMPHETRAKLDRMMDFLTRTAQTVDFFTVSSFYLMGNSPWGKDPAKFGIERISDPNQLLEEQAFNEVADGRWTSDNLKWPEKRQQIIDSTRRFYKTISAAKGQTRCVGGNIDLYLLMFLYSALGHDQKAEITRIYVETAPRVNPSSRAGRDDEGPLAPEAFRIQIPTMVDRVNEGDQSSLLQVPVTITVSPKSAARPGFCDSIRFNFAYRTPRILGGDGGGDDRLSRGALASLKEGLPGIMAQLGKSLEPFAKGLELRHRPESAARMAQLLAEGLPRYQAFANFGYTVVGPPKGRDVEQRMLEWSGLA